MKSAALLLLLALPASAAEPQPANALLILPSEKTAFDPRFQGLLDKSGAKLLESYPPSVFVGYIPPELDAKLMETYGAQVFRERVEDWGPFARLGEKAVFAVNAWNKRFVDDPPEAPLVVSSDVKRAPKRRAGFLLNWNAVMKALHYRLQIARDAEFSKPLVDARTAANEYLILPAFWQDGVYYWRVAGVLGLNTGELREGPFSETYNFAISRPGSPEGKKLESPRPPQARRFGKTLQWGPSGLFKYYRLQVSETADFAPPLADVFTDTCSYRAEALPLKPEAGYFMRVMGSDGTAYSGWSQAAEIYLEKPKRREPRRAKKDK